MSVATQSLHLLNREPTVHGAGVVQRMRRDNESRASGDIDSVAALERLTTPSDITITSPVPRPVKPPRETI